MQTLKPGPRDRDVRRSSWMGSGLVYPIGEQADNLKARFEETRIGPFSFGLRKKGAAKDAAKVQGLAFCEYPHLPVWAKLFRAQGAYAFRRARFDASPIGPFSFGLRGKGAARAAAMLGAVAGTCGDVLVLRPTVTPKRARTGAAARASHLPSTKSLHW